MQHNGFRLITLGRIALLSPTGQEDASLGTRRRKLALLAVLALADRPYSRHVLVDMFWGEESDERARHSLSDALSHLRRSLGRTAITGRQADIALSPGARLAVDALEFAAACEARDYVRAIALYGGPFLDGVHVRASPRFESWLVRERSRLEQLFAGACDAHCLTLARARRWKECGELAQRWLDTVPTSVDAALYLMNARKAPDTREAVLAALAEYEALSARLEREYHTRPDPRVVQLASDLRARIATQDASATPPAPVAPVTTTPPSISRQPAGAVRSARTRRPSRGRVRPRRRWPVLTAAAGLLAVAGAAGITMLRTGAAEAGATAPIVAVTVIQNVRGDTAVAWLQDGLKQMIAADLAHSSAVRVVAPSRVRDVIARGQFGPERARTTEDAIEIARRVGATWAISGGITKGDGVYVVDVGVRDVATGKLLRLFTVTGSDILAVADQAAARVLSAANAQSPGPRLAEIETSSLDAYQHYVRSTEAANEGRYSDQIRELDAAIAADSGFVSAIVQRLDVARMNANHALERRLVDLFARSRGRASEWDRRVQDVYAAQHNGELRRAERLAHELVARFPHNPRAYERLGSIYMAVGRWHAADTVYQEALSLDSLALEAGHGPCAPCTGLQGLSWLRLRSGDLAGGERAARRWVALQPDAPAPWSMLSTALAYAGRYPEALKAGRRAALLSRGEPQYALRIGRILVMARRFDAADSAAHAWLARPGRDFHVNAFELREIVLRERGQLRAADRVIDSVIARYPGAGELILTKGNDLGRLGQWHAVARIYEAHSHFQPVPESASPFMPLDGDGARAFSWHHALEADAIAGSGDTLRLRVLADSIQMISARSYYGRDWRLAHHVRGLIAMQGHRYAEAAREFQAARWGASGWTVTVADLARAQLALGQPRRAIATLREGYEAPPDAMARYAIRSELDLLMARAFQRAGMPDSSAVYATYVRRAWRHADPELEAELSLLDRASDNAAHTK